MKSDNYIVIQGFMLNELQLKGNELLIFACIYGFSQDGESRYKGGRRYLSETFNISMPTVDKALKNLLDLGLIEKIENTVNNVTFNEYQVSLWVVKKLYGGSKVSLPGVVKKLYGGSKVSLPNNIYNNTNNRNIREIGTFDDVVSSFDLISNNKDIEELVKEYIKLLKNSGKPFTPYSLKLKIEKAIKYSAGDPEVLKEIFKKAIDKCWLDIYPLKPNEVQAIKLKNNNPGADTVIEDTEEASEELNNILNIFSG